MNISICPKLISSIKDGDIILAYEPKVHKISKDGTGSDGYCCKCPYNKPGRQSFIGSFELKNEPVIIRSMEELEKKDIKLFDNWYSENVSKPVGEKREYLTKYFETNSIVIFPVEFRKSMNYSLKGLNIKMIRGFDKLHMNKTALEYLDMEI